jgi:hypothetical protein
MDVNQPPESRSVLPAVSLGITAVALAVSLFMPVLTLGLGVIAAGLGFVSYKQTRRGGGRDRSLGLWALIAGLVPLVFGVMWFGIALFVNASAGPAD